MARIDESIALARIQRRRQQALDFSQERAQADAEELAVRRAQLDRQYTADYFQQGLSNAQKLAISRQYLADKETLEQEFSERARERERAGLAFGLEAMSGVLQTVADFQKIASDKELAKVEKDKKARLASLETEYKAGKLSKEQYEAQKSSIEASYDEKTRALRRKAAEQEKELNIAQAIIQGTLSVLKASPNVPLMVVAGVTAAAGVAKIIATPLPEFEQGGIFSRARRQFARGGRYINPTAGVADVGQRHSGGGIRMVDGATGEHLGEWERGEAYMILSRDTYANNKHLVDALLDTSLHRGGAPVRQPAGYFEQGGTFTSGPATSAAGEAGQAGNQELLQAVNRVEKAVLALPSRQYVGWDRDDTAELEQRLQEREADRQRGQIR